MSTEPDWPQPPFHPKDYPALLEFPGRREREERKALRARIAVRLAPRVSKGLRVTWEGRAPKG